MGVLAQDWLLAHDVGQQIGRRSKVSTEDSLSRHPVRALVGSGIATLQVDHVSPGHRIAEQPELEVSCGEVDDGGTGGKVRESEGQG